jgi:protein gp37
MGTRTGIEWTDATWNPMTGCTKVTAGCDHCYAAVVAMRRTRDLYLARPPVRDTPAHRADPFAPRFWEDRLEQPLRWREPRRVFVNSMSDVFHAHFSVDQIRRVFRVMVLSTSSRSSPNARSGRPGSPIGSSGPRTSGWALASRAWQWRAGRRYCA